MPKYRGPNPYYWVIKNQEAETGVTFHLMDEKYDSGAILAQEIIKIYPSDTGKTLKERTVLAARGAVCELLKALSEDIIIPLQQREDRATYFSHPNEFELNFKNTAEENSALIRANYPWNKSYFYHDIVPIEINPNRISIEDNNTEFVDSGTVVGIDIETKTVSVLCSDNKVLKMSDVSLYKDIDKPFTRNYLRGINVGEVLY